MTRSQSEFTYNYSVDTLYGQEYQIGVRHDPSINDVDSFAAILFYSEPDGTRVEVAKVDDSEHEGQDSDIHVDRYYRADGADKKDHDVDISSWEEAEEYLKENWKRFARLYRENHGI